MEELTTHPFGATIERMAEVLETPRWQAVGKLIDQNQRDFLAGLHPLAEDVLSWFKSVELFRTTQDERMVLREPTNGDMRQHRTWISGLIAEGERLATEFISQGSRVDTEAKFQLADLEATVDVLYLWQREWHGPKISVARRQEILKSVLDVEESST